MTFSISAKIQDGGQNSGNLTFFTGIISNVCSTQRVQTLLEITLSLRDFEINDIFYFCHNSRCQPKFYSQDKCVFAFYAEIQDGHQKWQQSNFCEMSPVHSSDTLWVKNLIKITLSQTVSKINALYAEIQDGHQKWREKNVLNDFCEKLPLDSADNLQIRNFVEITLSPTVSKINVFCILWRNLRWPPKNGGKVIFAKCRRSLCRYPVGPKFCRNCSMSHHLQNKCALCRNSRWLPKVAGIAIFVKSRQ